MASDGEENSKEKIKVTDKRRFQSDGSLSSAQEEASDLSESFGKEAEILRDASVASSQDASDSEINFSSFVISLATQVLMQLGEMAAPEGYEIPQDRIAAKQTIDILQMLHEKTKGNLEKEEEALMKEILHSLRMSFVRKK
jgi:hypothetical protein